jgi:hypothetical protein
MKVNALFHLEPPHDQASELSLGYSVDAAHSQHEQAGPNPMLEVSLVRKGVRGSSLPTRRRASTRTSGPRGRKKPRARGSRTRTCGLCLSECKDVLRQLTAIVHSEVPRAYARI